MSFSYPAPQENPICSTAIVNHLNPKEGTTQARHKGSTGPFHGSILLLGHHDWSRKATESKAHKQSEKNQNITYSFPRSHQLEQHSPHGATRNSWDRDEQSRRQKSEACSVLMALVKHHACTDLSWIGKSWLLSYFRSQCKILCFIPTHLSLLQGPTSADCVSGRQRRQSHTMDCTGNKWCLRSHWDKEVSNVRIKSSSLATNEITVTEFKICFPLPCPSVCLSVCQAILSMLTVALSSQFNLFSVCSLKEKWEKHQKQYSQTWR